MYTVIFSKAAIKLLKKLPRDYQFQIKNSVLKLCKDPFDCDLKKLSPLFDATHRFRVGSYRLFLHIDTRDKKIIITKIVRHTSQTYN